jgi:Cof subfamily protein (haloacid dehalogenase superfamily)
LILLHEDSILRRPGILDGPRECPFRLAAIDIDDTLIGKDRRISEANAAAIGTLRRAGVRIVLASGRSHANMLRFHRELRLEGEPLISAQGAVVRDGNSGAAWYEHPLKAELVSEATRDAISRGFTVQHYRRDGIYVQTRDRWTEYDQSRNDEPQVLVDDLLADGVDGVFKLSWLGEPDRIAVAEPAVANRYRGRLGYARTDPEYLEFTDAAVNKAVGLERVAAEFGIDATEIVAFGDGNNDVPMLVWAGIGVAMGHARDAAKGAADVVGPEGDVETSLARAIRAVLAAFGHEEWPGAADGQLTGPTAAEG